MARATQLQTSFNGGILDPLAAEREDTTAYTNSVKDLLNMRVRPQGGAQLRPGLAYLGGHRGKLVEVDAGSASVRTIGIGRFASPGSSGGQPPPEDPPTFTIKGITIQGQLP